MDLTSVFAIHLAPGDKFLRGSNGYVVVTVLSESEPTIDLFGQAMYRYWCSRADSGAEGWMMFGLEGIVHKIND